MDCAFFLFKKKIPSFVSMGNTTVLTLSLSELGRFSVIQVPV